jgi:hypothetical protein
VNYNDVAIIVGNGTSRNVMDLAAMVRTMGDKRPRIYGCNALYREYESAGYIVPDYLVAIDDGIITEIESSTFPAKRVIIPPEDERWEPQELHIYDGEPSPAPRGNAGTVAMLAAIRNGAKTLLCIGFDSFLQDAKQSVSNLYDGTENYGPETRANVADNFGRVRYMAWIARTNPDIDFVFVYPEGMSAVPMGETNIFQSTFNNLMESGA